MINPIKFVVLKIKFLNFPVFGCGEGDFGCGEACIITFNLAGS